MSHEGEKLPQKCPGYLAVPKGSAHPGAWRAVKRVEGWAAPDPMLPNPHGHRSPRALGRGSPLKTQPAPS